MYGHIGQLAHAEKEGIERAGGSADLFLVPETLPGEVLTKVSPATLSTITTLKDT